MKKIRMVTLKQVQGKAKFQSPRIRIFALLGVSSVWSATTPSLHSKNYVDLQPQPVINVGAETGVSHRATDKLEPRLISATASGCEVEVPPAHYEVFILVGVPPHGTISASGGGVDQIVWIRRHRIARIRVHPYKYERKKVKVSWSNKGNFGLPEDTRFEDILKMHVVNYESSKNWVRTRKSGMQTLKSAPPKCKILVIREGIYRIDYDDISTIFPEITTSDPRTIKVSHCGFEVPIVVKGEEDGKFDQDDWFEFYAKRKEGKLTYLHFYSDTNVYWVSVGGAPGSRLVQESGALGQAPTPDSSKFKNHLEEDSICWYFKEYPDTIDPWFWAKFSLPNFFCLNTPDPASEGECSLRVAVCTSDTAPGECYFFLNNYFIGKIEYPKGDGVPCTLETSFPQSILKDSSLLSIEPTITTIYFNSLEISYFRLYKARNGRIRFGAPVPNLPYKFEIKGFMHPGIRVWKVGTSVIVNGKIEYADTTSTYTYTFQDTTEPNVFYYAQDHILKPIEIRSVESDLRSPLNQADYVIITNQELYDCAMSYAIWKETQGFTCKVVMVQQIYDEFNFGLEDPDAIQDFLRYAFEVWMLPPVYVLLLGDASFDHRNILGFGDDIVPSKTLYDGEQTLIPCDNLYACISGEDPIPDLFLARLPVKNYHEFTLVFQKLQQYEQPLWGEWRNTLLFTSMETEQKDNLIDTTEVIIRKYVPPEFRVKRIYYPHLSQPELIDAINKGALLLTFMGHSGLGDWAGGLLWRESIPGLMNPQKLPFVAVLGCYNGIFDGRPKRPGEDFMGELFIKSPGGAIGYWGPTGISNTGGHGLVGGPVEALCTINTKNTSGSLAMHGIIKCFKTRGYPVAVLQNVLLADPTTPIYTPSRDMSLTLIPPSLAPGDSGTIFGEIGCPTQGLSIITIYTTDTTEFKKATANIDNGKFITGFRLPDTIPEATAKITAYAWNDTTDFVGITRFSIDKPCIYPIYIIPPTPSSKDSVIVKAKAFDQVGIDGVKCRWGVNPPPWNTIDMDSDTSGFFITKWAIPPQPPKTKVSLKIELKNWNGEIFAVPDSYKVLSLPDLSVYQKFGLSGTSQVNIYWEIINRGEQSTDSFPVDFYAIDSDTFLLGTDTLSLNGGEWKIASLPCNLKKGKAFIIIDPDNMIEESDETNNHSGVRKFPVTLFNVTKQSGTQGWVASVDALFNYSPFRCRIDSNSIQMPTVLELKDTTSGYLARFRIPDIELLQPMSIAISPDSFFPRISIYRWCQEYKRWLLIAPDTLAYTQKFGLFSLIQRMDTIPPEIKLNIPDESSFFTDKDTISLKIEGVASDSSGIDIVDRKLIITCNNVWHGRGCGREEGSLRDTVPDSLYSYPTEPTSIYALPFVLRKSFPIGEHILSFVAYDFHGNRAEKKVKISINPPFAPAGGCWGNYPDPVRGDRALFYFEFNAKPDEFYMELYTVSGRLLQVFYPPLNKRIEFYWDLTANGKPCANGAYFYKVFARKGETKITRILKLAILK